MLYDLIIIGSGPAGYTAAIYAARAGLKTVVMEGFDAGGYPPGGQLTSTAAIYNWPGSYGISGPELMDNIRNQVEKCGAELLMETVTSLQPGRPNKVITEDGEYYGKAVIIATGASATKLSFTNSDTFWNKGISSCAICDGNNPRFANGNVVVVGSREGAASTALYLSQKAKKVYVLARADFTLSKASMDQLEACPNIELIRDTEVAECNGTDWLESIKTVHRSVFGFDYATISCVGLFFAVGHEPNTSFVPDEFLSFNGYLSSFHPSEHCCIYAAGDCVADKEYKQAIIAAGEGAYAALRVVDDLKKFATIDESVVYGKH